MKVFAPPAITDITLDGQNVKVPVTGLEVSDEVGSGLIKSFGFTTTKSFFSKDSDHKPAAQPAVPQPVGQENLSHRPPISEDVSDAGAGDKKHTPQTPPTSHPSGRR